jgi:DNA-binding transcriptional LysR family regulator
VLPDIDSLALFMRAAELRSLTKAAEASHISLAAASRRMALLEHRLKTVLLERSPRGVEVTPAGASLLVHAKAILLQINQMQLEMNDHAAGRKGTIRIFANTSVMTEFLPTDLASFAKAHTAFRMVVKERWSSETAAAVVSGEADIGIIVEGLHTEGLDTFPYRSDRLSVVFPADHPLALRQPLRFEDVLDHDIIALEDGASMMRLLTEQAVVAEKTFQLRIQVRSFEAVCRMVQVGLGVGLLPHQAAMAIGGGMGLSVRPLPEAWAERTMLICLRKDRAPNSSIVALLKYLTTACRTVASGPQAEPGIGR